MSLEILGEIIDNVVSGIPVLLQKCKKGIVVFLNLDQRTGLCFQKKKEFLPSKSSSLNFGPYSHIFTEKLVRRKADRLKDLEI
jgi:hypothetical protein